MRTAVYRCDANPSVGYGHLERCLALALVLRANHSWHAVFAIQADEAARKRIESNAFDVCDVTGGTPERMGRWLERLVVERRADALILDVRDELPVTLVETVRATGRIVVTIDDSTSRRLAADLAFYPPVPQLAGLDWSGFQGQLHAGWDWIVMRPEFADYLGKCGAHRRSFDSSRVLVTMGGSDPAGLTMLALEALDRVDYDLTASVVLGPAFQHEASVSEFIKKARRQYVIRRDVSDMPALMAEADLAIASFGLTAYELAAMGVPAVYVCLTPDHSRSAEALDGIGAGVSLGDYRSVSTATLSRAVLTLLNDTVRRRAMSETAMRYVDGRGTERVALAIVTSVSSAHILDVPNPQQTMHGVNHHHRG